MFRVRVKGCQRNLQKIAMTKAIRKRAEINLVDAKMHTDAVLDGREILISTPSRAAATKLTEELVSFGAIAECVDD